MHFQYMAHNSHKTHSGLCRCAAHTVGLISEPPSVLSGLTTQLFSRHCGTSAGHVSVHTPGPGNADWCAEVDGLIIISWLEGGRTL
mmetsp:Transcript_67880/g.134634  ORF Transcript_67880/g.134634 Transcript_67880/m.134634 type:complete len:86 (+) Transcript_67880:45-302(+)